MLKKIFFILTVLYLSFHPTIAENHVVIHGWTVEKVDIHIHEQQNIYEYLSFKDKLAFFESSNNYQAVSRSGSYIGKYQFGYIALKDIDMHHIDRYDFLSTPYLQEMALFKKLNRNKYYLRNYISFFSGRTLSNGIKVTTSGILASAHLLGAGSVKRYLYYDGQIEIYDGNGTPLSLYLMEFANYDFTLTKNIKLYIEEHYDNTRYI